MLSRASTFCSKALTKVFEDEVVKYDFIFFPLWSKRTAFDSLKCRVIVNSSFWISANVTQVVLSSIQVTVAGKIPNLSLGPLVMFFNLFLGLLVSGKLVVVEVEVYRRQESGAILLRDRWCLETSQYPDPSPTLRHRLHRMSGSVQQTWLDLVLAIHVINLCWGGGAMAERTCCLRTWVQS